MKQLLIVATLVSLIAVPSRFSIAQNYDVLTLDIPFEDLHWAVPSAIDELGNVVGNMRHLAGDQPQSAARRGFYFDRGTGAFSFADLDLVWVDSNNHGEIVGSDFSVHAPHGTIWNPQFNTNIGGVSLYWTSPQAEPITLPPLPGDIWTGVSSINDAGLIVGISYDTLVEAPPHVTPVVWQVTESGVSDPIALPLVSGETAGFPEGISPPNSNGVSTIVGRIGYPLPDDEEQYAVRWKLKLRNNGKLVLKEGPVVLGSSFDLGYSTTGIASTSKAFAVGSLNGSPYKVSNRGTLRLLKSYKVKGNLPTDGYPLGVNESKDTVGVLEFPGNQDRARAALWPQGRKAIDLNKAVVFNRHLAEAHGINSLGEIVVTYTVQHGLGRPAILIPNE